MDAYSDSVFDVTSPPSAPVNPIASAEIIRFTEPRSDLSNASSPYSIIVQDLLSNWYLRGSMLEVEFEITAGNDDPLTTADLFGLQPDGWCLFESAKLRIGNSEIASQSQVGTSHYLKSLLEYSKDYLEVAKGQGFIPDKSITGDGNSNTPVQRAHLQLNAGSTGMNANFDQGYFDRLLQRSNAINYNSGTMRLMLPVAEVFPFIAQFDRVMCGQKIELVLYKNTLQTTVIHGYDSSNKSPKAVINAISWHIPRLVPSLGASAALAKALMSNSTVDFSY
jgi:hypothetical protein